MFEIPKTFDQTKTVTKDEATRIIANGEIFFTPKLEERIEVTAWFRYPSYDFIFGLPTGKRAEKECACMWVRYSGGKQYCVYFDKQELDDTLEALGHLQEVQEEFEKVTKK
tara:strand:- start:48 stop:380 length:333 start_codon:yes stop_codon:yes gene_type:complete